MEILFPILHRVGRVLSLPVNNTVLGVHGRIKSMQRANFARSVRI